MLFFDNNVLKDVAEEDCHLNLVKKRTGWVIKGLLFTTLMGMPLLFGGQKVQARGWKANSKIEITERLNNQDHSFVFIEGDTFYEVSQVLNINFNKLMELNNFNSGEQYNIPIGTKISFSGERVSIISAEGILQHEEILETEDKVDKKLPFANQVAEISENEMKTVASEEEQPEENQVIVEGEPITNTGKLVETDVTFESEEASVVEVESSETIKKQEIVEETPSFTAPTEEVAESKIDELELEKTSQVEETLDKIEEATVIEEELEMNTVETEEVGVETEDFSEMEKIETELEVVDELKEEDKKLDSEIVEEVKENKTEEKPVAEKGQKQVKQAISISVKPKQSEVLTANQTLLASRQAGIQELMRLSLTPTQREIFKKEVNRGKTVRQINGSLENARRLASKVTFNQEELKKAETNLLSLLNKERQGKNVVALKRDATLDQAANIRAQEIKQQFTHNRPNGNRFYTSVSDVLGKVWHSSYNNLGENLATVSHYKKGNEVATDLYTRWKASPSHYKNMIAGKFNSIGMALVEIEGTIYTVTLYGNK